ncbi:hypothetical protein Tco_0281309 [Tanacetum coccineum]
MSASPRSILMTRIPCIWYLAASILAALAQCYQLDLHVLPSLALMSSSHRESLPSVPVRLRSVSQALLSRLHASESKSRVHDVVSDLRRNLRCSTVLLCLEMVSYAHTLDLGGSEAHDGSPDYNSYSSVPKASRELISTSSTPSIPVS